MHEMVFYPLWRKLALCPARARCPFRCLSTAPEMAAMVGGQPNPRAQHQQSIPSTGREACLPGARCLSRCLSTAPKATTLSVPPIPRAQHHRSIPSTGREAYPPGARCLSTAPKMAATVGALSTQSTPTVHPYESIPNTGRNTWLNFYRLWRTNGFQYFHQVMERNFRTYGPIYRENIGTHHSVNIMHPRDVAELFQSEGIFPRRMRVEAWAAHRQLRNHKCGVFLLNGEDWRSDRLVLNKEVMALGGVRKFLPFLDQVAQDFVTFMQRRVNKNSRGTLTVDLYSDLFRFTLEASSYVLYGARLGLLEENPNSESLRFITAVQTMLRTTLPLLFMPPALLQRMNSKLWTEHVTAWDTIFDHAEKCIQNIYQEFCLGQERKYCGIMAELLLQGELSLDSIKANITELMAGGVDTTAMPLLFTLFELARNPQVQTLLREEIKAADSQGHQDITKLLNSLPLLKGAIKETLRLYPVGITVQRYPTKDVTLHNYRVPAGTLVQVGLYAMGRSSEVFTKPGRYDPERWLNKDDNGFKALAFGFGSRQCIGRRIAEMEMMLFLVHVLRNFQIDTVSKEDVKTVFRFILMPEKPPLLTFRPIS